MLTECFQIRLRFPRKPRKVHCLTNTNNEVVVNKKKNKNVSVFSTPQSSCPPVVIVTPAVAQPSVQISVAIPDLNVNGPRLPATPQPKKRLRLRGNARKLRLLKALADG